MLPPTYRLVLETFTGSTSPHDRPGDCSIAERRFVIAAPSAYQWYGQCCQAWGFAARTGTPTAYMYEQIAGLPLFGGKPKGGPDSSWNVVPLWLFLAVHFRPVEVDEHI